jgi:hypothetical protein
MAGLINDLSLQFLGAVQGSVPPENFRQWLMSSMLDFESSEDDGLIDLVFSLELLGFEFERGDRSPENYLATMLNAVQQSPLADRLLPSARASAYFFDSPSTLGLSLETATVAASPSRSQRMRLFFGDIPAFSPPVTALFTFAKRP